MLKTQKNTAFRGYQALISVFFVKLLLETSKRKALPNLKPQPGRLSPERQKLPFKTESKCLQMRLKKPAFAGKTWEKLGKLGKIWEKLGKLGKTWENLGKLGKIWEKLGKLGKTWENLGKLGKIWENLGKSGKTWENLGKFQKTVHPTFLGISKNGQSELLEVNDSNKAPTLAPMARNPTKPRNDTAEPEEQEAPVFFISKSFSKRHGCHGWCRLVVFAAHQCAGFGKGAIERGRRPAPWSNLRKGPAQISNTQVLTSMTQQHYPQHHSLRTAKKSERDPKRCLLTIETPPHSIIMSGMGDRFQKSQNRTHQFR